ncbi:hypothetical protein AB0F13_20525 [Streptomyces sp. NPDC026206]|uniref:hypothetical protein n=1 Tax=Streptomyces sp. NPDC026206 TaxID=3157089 RepID=UPI0033D19AF9
MRIWTRLTGWATLLVGYATALLGVVPLRELPPKRHELQLLAATGVCAACWLLASSVVRASRRAALRRKAWRRRHEPWPEPRSSRLLCWVLGFGIALTSMAALCQGVGPDGAEGEWLARADRAGGSTYELRIEKILGAPRPTDAEINGADEYASTIVVSVPFASGPRQVTVDAVHTSGKPEEGRTVELLYAPDRPDLGVRQAPDNDIGSFAGRIIALPTIWILGLAAGLVTSVALHRREAGVRYARRFEPWVHLPAAAVLACGAALVVPLLIGFPGTGTGWCLAAAAAATPWLALTWVVKTR